MAEQEDKGAILREALAEYYDCEPEDIGGWIMVCEKNDEGTGVELYTAWSTSVPYWSLLGFLSEGAHTLKQKYRGVMGMPLNGEAAVMPNRRGRRGSRGG